MIKLIGENGRFLGLFKFENAILKAKESNMDLIKINDRIKPNIYKIGDYNKFIFLKKKNKVKQKQKTVKEMSLRLNTHDNDYNIKIKKILLLLKKNNIKVNIKLFGRENLMKKKIEDLILRICVDIKKNSISNIITKNEKKNHYIYITSKNDKV
ncbi:translation initiation factor IF-3 [Candidatus Vidania fulgoroideorum]